MINEIPCPTCKKSVPWTEESLYRPFCSQRCQLIDLGEWSEEKFSIPAVEGPDGEEDF